MSTTRITTILGILATCLIATEKGSFFDKKTNDLIGTAGAVVTAIAFYYTQGRQPNGKA